MASNSEQEDLMLPPVLPGEELGELDEIDQQLLEEGEEEEEEEQEDKPKRRRKKPRKKASKETIEKRIHARDMDLDEWIADVEQKYGWDRPGMQCQLHRIYPEWYKKVRVGGLVAKRDGGVFDSGEIADEFGGGEYEMWAVIPPAGYGKPPTKRKKRFSISGLPKISDMQQPSKDDGAPQQHDDDISNPVVQRGLLGFAGQMQKQLYDTMKEGGKSGIDIDQLRAPYERAMEQMESSYEERARAREESARESAKMAELRAQEAKLEAEAAKRERDKILEETKLRIQEAAQGSNQMLSALLPSFNENASRQVDAITATFTARETNIEQRHAQELESLRRYHESQLQQSRTMQSAEVSRMEATFQAQLGLLQQQLQHYQQQAQVYQAENLKLRDELMQMRVTQIEQLKTSQDPITKISEMQQMAEVVKDVLPGLSGGGGGEDDLGDAPPYLKMINNAVNKIGPAVSAVLQTRAQPQMPPQMMPPHMMPPQMPPQAMVPGGPQVPVPAGPEEPAPPPEPRGVKLKVSDVKELISVVGNVYKSGTTTPEQAAAAALKALPHDMLRVLTKKEPKGVMQDFEKAGLVGGTPLEENAGQDYAIQVLENLRKNL